MSLYRTSSAAQLSLLVRTMAGTKDANHRARLLHGALQAVIDLDRAAACAVDFMRDSEDKKEKLQVYELMAQEIGLTFADPNVPLSLEN